MISLPRDKKKLFIIDIQIKFFQGLIKVQTTKAKNCTVKYNVLIEMHLTIYISDTGIPLKCTNNPLSEKGFTSSSS